MLSISMSNMEGRRISRKPIPDAVQTASEGEAEREAERDQARRHMTALSNVSGSNDVAIDSHVVQPQKSRRGCLSFFQRRRQVEEPPVTDESKNGTLLILHCAVDFVANPHEPPMSRTLHQRIHKEKFWTLRHTGLS